jgi:protein AroM
MGGIVSAVRTLAAVTIGQSPRDDIVPEMQSLVPGTVWIQAGALDGMVDEEIARLAPAPGDFPLVTRLADGRAVVVGAESIHLLLEGAVRRVEQSADVVVLLCSGMFSLACRAPLLLPGRLLMAAARTVANDRPIAVFTPEASQVGMQERRWRDAGLKVTVYFASPYLPTDFSSLGERARDAGTDLIVLDCLGYTRQMKAEVAAASGRPVLLVRSLTARVAAELVS